MVAAAALESDRDELAIWEVILEAVRSALDRLTKLSQRAAADLRAGRGLEGSASAAFFVARGCLAVVEVCPALGAAVVTAAALQLASNTTNNYQTPPLDSSHSKA